MSSYDRIQWCEHEIERVDEFLAIVRAHHELNEATYWRSKLPLGMKLHCEEIVSYKERICRQKNACRRDLKVKGQSYRRSSTKEKTPPPLLNADDNTVPTVVVSFIRTSDGECITVGPVKKDTTQHRDPRSILVGIHNRQLTQLRKQKKIKTFSEEVRQRLTFNAQLKTIVTK